MTTSINHFPNGKKNILAIIQARMSSSRLPGKVLLDICGQPMLARVIERTRKAKMVNGVVVATTIDPSDDAIVELCQKRDYVFFRGSMHDVLDRYYQAARASEADIIVRITADCPLIDAELIDDSVKTLLGQANPESLENGIFRTTMIDRPSETSFDFVANRLPPPWYRTYPIGLDVEVCSFAALSRAWQEADQPFQREHVMPYLYEGISPMDTQDGATLLAFKSLHGFRVALLNHDRDYGQLRWTVDTPEDLELIRQIYKYFPGREYFSWLEVLSLVENKSELKVINADIQPKIIYDVDQRRIA
jgi:spore coat polysaccharide biosynthesis protein SpsF